MTRTRDPAARIYAPVTRDDASQAEWEADLVAWRTAGDLVARGRFIEANLPLAKSVATRHCFAFPGQGDDIVGAAMLGLIKAVDTFDVSRGVRFATYAAWWIKSALSQWVHSESQMIRVPRHWHTAAVRSDPDNAGLAAEFDRFRRCKAAGTPAADAPNPLLGVTAAGEPADAWSACLADLDGALSQLSSRDREIICRVHGLGRPVEVANAVAADLGVSRQRVSQMVSRARRRMREYVQACEREDGGAENRETAPPFDRRK